MDEALEVRKKIAYKIWEDTKNPNSERNWKLAGEILNHFLDRRPGDPKWREDHMCWCSFERIIYG